MCILLHAIATRISTSLSQLHISVPFLLHSAFALSLHVSFTCSVNSALLLLYSPPYSVPFPTLPISFPGFLFRLTFSQTFPGCRQGQQVADRVTSCHKNEQESSLLSISPLQHHLQSPFHLNCHHSDLKDNGQKEEGLWRVTLNFNFNLFSRTS